MREQMYEVYHVLKANEGGAGQIMKMHQLKAAGIKCKRDYSPYVGHSAIRVYGNKRIQKRADKIVFG